MNKFLLYESYHFVMSFTKLATFSLSPKIMNTISDYSQTDSNSVRQASSLVSAYFILMMIFIVFGWIILVEDWT